MSASENEGSCPKDDDGDPPTLSIKLPKMSNMPRKSKPWNDDHLPVDILLLTVEDCEFLACYFYLRDPIKSYHKCLGFVYFGNMGDEEMPLKVALIKCSRDTLYPGASQTAAKNVVTQLRPKVTFSVGSCRGLNHEKAKLGDVVISSKLTTDAFKTPVSRDFGNLVRNAAHGWEAPLENPEAREVIVHCDGEILSCPDPVSAEQQCKLNPGAIALEMQGKGIFAAVHDVKSEYVLVKGVSHFADSSTHESWKTFACVMAASLVSNILFDSCVFQQWPHYEVKEGLLNDDDLERLSSKIAAEWKPLGRRLGIGEAELQAFHEENKKLFEKAYRMLLYWKESYGSAATYLVLYTALRHSLVNREDLAEEFCSQISGHAPPLVKVGSPSDDELERLAFALTGTWKQLGRLLQLKDSILRALDAEPLKLIDKARRMLMYWKEKEGSNATYQVLSDALRHEFVRRDDLAEKICNQGSERGTSEAVLYSKLTRKAELKEKIYLPDVKLETKSESKVKVEPSYEELDINKMETELSDKKLDTKKESKVKVEPSDVELDTKPENTIKIEPSGKGLNAKTGTKAEFPDVDMDTESESKMEIEMPGEGPYSMSDNSMKTMPNVDLEQCEISDKGAVWKLQDIHVAAYITFPQNALRGTVWFRCTRKEPTKHSPPLKKDEALVSNVIELSYDDSPTSSFTGNFGEKVLVDISHSAANLKGYEVVIRELVDTYNNEWKDLETTNIWQASEIQGEFFSKPTPPFAEAHVTCCSTFAVVCRLKSYTYSARELDNRDFLCAVQDYPDVSVTIPASVVNAQKELQLTLKVQEIPHQWFEKTEIIVGPVLHVACSHNLELLGQATITIPISLQADRREFSSRNVKVLVSSDETSDWKDITRQLPSPAELTNGVVTFEVTHFSRFHVLVEKRKRKRRMQRLRLGWHKQITQLVPTQQAGFSACLCNAESLENDKFVLIFCCYPIHLVSKVKNEIYSGYKVLLYNDGNSFEPLSENDEIRVALEGLSSSTKDLRVRFLGVINFKASAPVRRDPQYGIPEVIFTRDIREKRRKPLCRLALTPPASTTTTQSQTVREGIADDEDLEKLSQKIAEGWKPLGRRLGIKESKLKAFNRQNDEYSEKAYQMLLYWKQREGSKATYRVLHDALVHSLVDRRDLAEEICSG